MHKRVFLKGQGSQFEKDPYVIAGYPSGRGGGMPDVYQPEELDVDGVHPRVYALCE